MAQSPSSLEFSVQRCQPELVTPAKPTPHELKLLSDIDDQDGLRFHVPLIHFFQSEPSMAGKDPAQVIRDALAKALVFYYPFAGRLREGPGRKLIVDCNGEGVLFIEADADVRLDQFGDSLQPPFPCFQELLYNVPGSDGIINCPLCLIQVTRLKCGGFIFGLRFNHTMTDGTGISQFLNAIAEIAKGDKKPSITPVWCRELLSARNPPSITCTHREYEDVPQTKGTIISPNELQERSFFLGSTEVATIRRRFISHHLGSYTTFEILTACLWRCRTIALQMDSNEEVRMMVLVNGRAKFQPLIPVGYYGNVFAYPAAVTTAGKLCGNPLTYALELVKKAKDEVTEEYMHSVADLMVIKGRPYFTTNGSFILSDNRHLPLREVDFGWGKPLYGGVAKSGGGEFAGISFCVSVKNAKGDGVIIPITLPAEAMDRFAKELDKMISVKPIWGGQDSTVVVQSKL